MLLIALLFVLETSCDEFLLGKKIGPQSCLMQETDLMFEGRAMKRLDIGLSGTADGFITKTGDYKEYLTNAPDLVFPQTADPGPVLHAVARYEREKGASMTVIFPADRNAWNGKMWVTAHGRGASFKEGQGFFSDKTVQWYIGEAKDAGNWGRRPNSSPDIRNSVSVPNFHQKMYFNPN